MKFHTFSECSDGLNSWGEAWDLGKFPQGNVLIYKRSGYNQYFIFDDGSEMKHCISYRQIHNQKQGKWIVSIHSWWKIEIY